MPIAIAKRMLALAKDGLKIVIVGAAPDRRRGQGQGSDAELRAIIADLLAQPTVSRVATEADVPAKLAVARRPPGRRARAALRAWSACTAPTTRPTPTTTSSTTRASDVIDTVTSRDERLRGPGGLPVHRDRRQPLRRGRRRVRPAGDAEGLRHAVPARHRVGRDHADRAVHDRHRHGDGARHARSRRVDDRRAHPAGRSLRRRRRRCTSSSTTADAAALADGSLVVRDTQPGTYTATLSDGRTVTGDDRRGAARRSTSPAPRGSSPPRTGSRRTRSAPPARPARRHQGPGEPDARRPQGVAGHPGARQRLGRRHLHHDGDHAVHLEAGVERDPQPRPGRRTPSR